MHFVFIFGMHNIHSAPSIFIIKHHNHMLMTSEISSISLAVNTAISLALTDLDICYINETQNLKIF